MTFRPSFTACCLWFFALSVFLVTVNGCGGKHTDAVGASETGRAAFTVRWPDPAAGRLVPFAANSVKITLVRGGTLLGERVVARPAGGGQATALFERLPITDFVATATAYPTADATGTAQATGQVPGTVVASQTTTIRITMGSTIDRVEVAPAALSVNVGQTSGAALIATAKDAAGSVVLTSPVTWEWRSLNPSVATVAPGGASVTGVASGTAVIEAKETESGKAGTATVTVPSPNPGGGTGTLLLYDGFDYTAGSRLQNASGGTGWRNGWNEYGSGYTPSVITTDGLTFGNLYTTGRAMKTTSRFPIGHARIPGTPLGENGTLLYASVLIRPLDPTNVGYSYPHGY